MNRAFWDERFGEPGFAYGEEPNDFLREVAARIPGGPVLCLAEGEGRNAVFLAQRGHAVTAVDQSPVGLAKAEALAQARGTTITTVEADLGRWTPQEEAYTGVIAIFAHLPPAERARMFAAAARALRPGGVLVIELYTPRQLAFGTGGPRDAALLVEPADLRRELASLHIDHLEEVERDIVEGRYHCGPSAVVRALAVKARAPSGEPRA